MQTTHKYLVIIEFGWGVLFRYSTPHCSLCWGGGASCLDKAGRISTCPSCSAFRITRLLSIICNFFFRTLWLTALLSKTQNPKPRDWLFPVFITTAFCTAPNVRKYLVKLSGCYTSPASPTICCIIRKTPHKNFTMIKKCKCCNQLDMESLFKMWFQRFQINYNSEI